MTKDQEEENFVKSDVRRTMLKIHILWRLTKSSTNAYSILKEFSDDKFAVSFFPNSKVLRDDVYNVLKSLEKSEFVVSSPKVENGRLKQYFQITEKGERVLKSSTREFHKAANDLETLFRE